MAKARARHILVAKQERAEELKQRIEGGESFAEVAKQYSLCPSGKQGGDLGVFSPGEMVPEFDKVVFSAEVGTVQGPVQTQFGQHLILVEERSE
ncbi:MAG: peptidylprolyl isomerase [Desulfovibrionales bacterium]